MNYEVHTTMEDLEQAILDIVKKSYCAEYKGKLKVSELKCDLFALTMKKRIEAAVEEWKGQVTDFETKEPTSFEVPLS